MRTGTFLLCLLVVFSVPAFAQRTPLANGNFESGTLSGWTATGINGGTAALVRQGSCFSYNNTEGLTLSGSYAANLRSSGVAPTDSVGILTSEAFIAGSSISFNALSEAEEGERASVSDNPVTFEARLIDASDNVLLAQIFKPNVATLYRSSGGECTGEPRDASFSNHIMDTSTFRGQVVKLQFRQHTNVPKRGFFTLVDDVTISPDAPTISLTVTGCHACQEGGRVTVQARLINPQTREVTVEVKAGGRLPDGTPINLFGQEHVELKLAPGFDKTIALFDGPLPAGVPEGTWTVEGTLLEPELGKTLSRDAKALSVK
jgi:hypothetical protein